MELDEDYILAARVRVLATAALHSSLSKPFNQSSLSAFVSSGNSYNIINSNKQNGKS
jgi:hypothetical protein